MMTVCREEIRMECLNGTDPVLVSDGIADWPALQRWSPSFLAATVAHRPVDVFVSSTGSFSYTPDGGALDPENQFVMQDRPFGDAAAAIVDESASSPKYYISQQDIALRLPELLTDLRFPMRSEGTRLNLWFGSSGTVTQLHFDPRNNLYAQIYGSKRFTVFGPEETPYLYPFPQASLYAHFSYVDPEKPEPEHLPLLQRARRITFTITAGQLLFLPAFWWHHVRSTGVSISANQWWPPTRSQCCGPYGMRYLADPKAAVHADTIRT